LGYGFLEKVYENAILIELKKAGISAVAQVPTPVYYENELVGSYFADILVDDLVILELKAIEVLSSADEKQLVNYSKATKFEVGMLFNFGKKPEFKRKIFTNDLK
jgi:GxxExxY protein